MMRPFAHPVACCCMFLRVAGNCCAKFETSQTFSYGQQCWELLRPFAHTFTHSLVLKNLLLHSWHFDVRGLENQRSSSWACDRKWNQFGHCSVSFSDQRKTECRSNQCTRLDHRRTWRCQWYVSRSVGYFLWFSYYVLVSIPSETTELSPFLQSF